MKESSQVTAVIAQTSKNQYDEEKVNGTRASTEKTNRILVIGGPSEGDLVPDYGDYYRVAESRSLNARLFEAVPKFPETNIWTEHRYRKEKIGFKDKIGNVYYKTIYLHESLHYETGEAALKDFLLRQFVMMELE